MFNFSLRCSFFLLAFASLSRFVMAGGGPENVLLVVNANSRDSVTVANHYINLRKIPTSNILYLDYTGDPRAIDVDTFRSKILTPITQAMKTRGLTTHIDIIAYSTNFPVLVDFSKEKGPVPVLPEINSKGMDFINTGGSLTGMTYLMHYVMAGAKSLYQHPKNNRYFRLVDTRGILHQRTHGFRSWYGWGAMGELQESGGDRYILSTMLGVNSKPGNSVAEIIKSLETSAKADYTRPKGTIYFTKKDVDRTANRARYFPFVIEHIKNQGVNAELLEADFPNGKKDVIGACIGAASLGGNQFTVVPGGIVDNLTSFGAVFDTSHGQPLLTDFIRMGAAGSSGTPIEPTSLPYKFPNAYLYFHYILGCSLAESFYQSVHGPYQLLIVGDPLCSPFATPSEIDTEEKLEAGPIKGTITIHPKIVKSISKVDRFELYVDGARLAVCGESGSFSLNSANYADGAHEIRVVGIQNNAIETQCRKIIPVTFDNYGKRTTITTESTKVNAGQNITLGLSSLGASSIMLFANGRVIGTYNAESTTVTLPTASSSRSVLLGYGPVQFRALSLGKTGSSGSALSPTVTVEIVQ